MSVIDWPQWDENGGAYQTVFNLNKRCSSARELFTFLIQINLGEGCLDQSTIEHEMFHALGIFRDIILEISY